MSDRQHGISGPSGDDNRAMGAGSSALASMLLGLGVGWLLDHWLATWPWGTVIACAVFVTVGLVQIVREYRPSRHARDADD